MGKRCMLGFWLVLAMLGSCESHSQKSCNNNCNNNTNNINNTNNNNINNTNNTTNNANNTSVIEPGDPGPADVEVFVDATLPGRPISPWIYGMNAGGVDELPRRDVPFWRIGGNRWTAYNWENNASNAGSDWNWQNDAYLGGGDEPAAAVVGRVEPALDDGAAVMVTLAMAGKVAADKAGPTDPQGADAETARFVDACWPKAAPFAFPPDTHDDCVYQDELVAHLLERFADRADRVVFQLDNEPDLWRYTHSEIHPQPATYAELTDKSISLARAVKDVRPGALVFGFGGSGFWGFETLGGAPDASSHFIDFFLAAFARAGAEEGRRLIDVLDIHWYPEARGGGVRITQDDASPEVARARVQAPRSLWDPDYVEDSWITRDYLAGPITLLPDLMGRIEAAYPGTRLSISEYYYGGGDHISGAIAQADVLGIFGREGVFAANLWHLGETDDAFILAAFDMYRNADGEGLSFGDLSIAASVSDVVSVSAYASKHTGIPYEIVLVLINKAEREVSVALRVRDRNEYGFARVWRLSGEIPAPRPDSNAPMNARNAGIVRLPAWSVSTLVLMPHL